MVAKSLIFALAFATSTTVCSQDWNSNPNNWENNPNNWDNSPYNWENNPNNWENNPNNWENNPNNWDNERIVRDNDGNPVGYAVPKANGGVNFFDFEGGRRGYTPSAD